MDINHEIKNNMLSLSQDFFVKSKVLFMKQENFSLVIFFFLN